MPTKPKTLDSTQVYAATGIPRGSLTFWALRVGVRPVRQKIHDGHVLGVWPAAIVRRIVDARDGSERVKRRRAAVPAQWKG